MNSLAGKLPTTLDHMETHYIDIPCLQEVRLTETTSVAVRDRVEARGMRFLLNPASIRVNGVGVFGGIAVFSRWPIVQLKTPECVTDKARCIFFRVHRPRQVPMVACSIHIDAMRNSPSRRTLVASVVRALHEMGGPHVIIGDFNATPPSEVPVAPELASGILSLDESDDVQAQPTRRETATNRTPRHIDYMLCSTGVRWDHRIHITMKGCSDHDLIGYDIMMEKEEQCYELKKKRRLRREMPQATIDAVWPQVWELHEPLFRGAIEHKDLEVAWRHLSHAAEALLSHADDELGEVVVVDRELRDGYGDRADEPRIVHKGEGSSRCLTDESVVMRRLRKLFRRCQQASERDGSRI